VPRKTFVAGEILTAADVNTNLMDQTVMVFDDAAARTTAIPSPVEGMVTYLKDVDRLEKFTTVFEAVNTGFTAGTAITATDASWPVPALAAPIVKVTVIGGGGGGSGAIGSGGGAAGDAGGAGTTTTFNAGGAGSPSASGGDGGVRAVGGATGATGTAGNGSSNGGQGGSTFDDSAGRTAGISGNGGAVTVSYLNLSGISTVDVTIGAGGGGGAAGRLNSGPGGAGGRGEVIVEYIKA